MITICKECASIRGIELPAIQKLNKCFLCCNKAMTSEISTSELKSPAIAFEQGFFTTDDLSKSLTMIKARKAVLAPRIKSIQIEISRPMREIKIQEALYLIKELVVEGLTKKSLNTCQKVFTRMGSITDSLEHSNKASKIVVLQNLMAEVSGLDEKEKELSILYKSALDTILINELRAEVGPDKFRAIFERSKKIYRA
jgi:hypothetical protein